MIYVCIYIMQDEKPSHRVLWNFINDYILPNDEKIFSLIAKAIFIECNFKMDKMYLDGSKFEVNAKYKYDEMACDKVEKL